MPRTRGGQGGSYTNRGTPAPNPRPSKQRRPPATLDNNNFRRHGFNHLPAAGEVFASWKVLKLREFLSVSPAMYRKSQTKLTDLFRRLENFSSRIGGKIRWARFDPPAHQFKALTVTCFCKLSDETPRTLPVLFLPQPFRCLDNAGTSGYNKSKRVKLAADVVRMVIRCGLVNNSVAFRNPNPDTSSFEEKVLNKLQDLPASARWVSHWEIYGRISPRCLNR